jgi:hypothetical protein
MINEYNISPFCRFELDVYDAFPSTLELVYTERSPDPWYSDTETCVDIDEDIAEGIVNFLIKCYPCILRC